MTSQNELKYWIAFSQFQKLGPVKFKKIINYFPNLQIAWQASLEELSRSGIDNETAVEIVTARDKINPDAELEKLAQEKVFAVTINDEGYPKLLKEIYNPPPLLYYRGEIKMENFTISVIGTRKCSPYGKQVTAEIVKELAENNIAIVSGLALGIDTIAHETTLKSGSHTIAVLGSGLDNKSIYPTSNYNLAQKIIESKGALISEHPIGAPPLKHHFPQRNRIISGLSLGTLVTEAPLISGALITTKFAVEHNREVFAVPGSIYSENATGTNFLIKMGATITTSAKDILETLNLQLATDFAKARKIIPDSKEEEILLKYLSKEPIHIDNLIKHSGLKTATVNSVITMMEIKGIVKNLGGSLYVLAR